MTRTERDELRRVVRQQFAVLREEVEQRRAELAAEAASRVRARYADIDKLVADVNYGIEQVVDQARKDIRAVVESLDPEQAEAIGWSNGGPSRMGVPQVGAKHEDRSALDRVLATGIQVTVHEALLRLKRQEADLNRQLALGAIESDEARAFLRSIPTVAELVPAARLAEIEAGWESEQQ